MNPRLLLVEDAPVSQAFLAEAARAVPAHVDVAGSLAEAMTLATDFRFDAWLIDAHLPDGRGIELLARLRETLPAPHPVALAHTASHDAAELATLREAGFAIVVSKPLSAAAWQAALRTALSDDKTTTWDDAAALRALNGNAGSVRALRGLFLAELPEQHAVILTALENGHLDTARGELHRLKAGCGFVGATRLRAAVDALHAAPASPALRHAFTEAVTELLARPAPNPD
ncbi:Hpt domain-containing response regulator [Solilutibacter pythonis]|nr:response regulator [Lysobacter pythonis]